MNTRYKKRSEVSLEYTAGLKFFDCPVGVLKPMIFNVLPLKLRGDFQEVRVYESGRNTILVLLPGRVNLNNPKAIYNYIDPYFVTIHLEDLAYSPHMESLFLTLLTYKDKGLDQLKILLHMLNESERLNEKHRSSMSLDNTS